MPLGVQYSGIWTMAQQYQAVGAGQWKGIVEEYLWTFGSNNGGQLGDNTDVNKSSPVQIGAVSTWSQISGGVSFSMALKTDGTMWTWGVNTDNGPLGDNTVIDKSSPVQVGSLTTWSQIDGGDRYSMALQTDGTMWTWGLAGAGRLGNNIIVYRSSPVQVGALTTWSKISAGGQGLSMAIKTDGTLWAFGYNTAGNLGDNTRVNRSSPIQVGALTTWSKISAGYHAMALKTDGTMWTWGKSTEGQLGGNDRVYRSSPVQVGALTTWSQIAGAHNHSMALKTDGTLWTFGYNGSGMLGDNTIIYRSSPIQVGALTTWSQISVGAYHSLAIKTDGTMWGWGSNAGRMGDNTAINRSSPVQVGSLTTWSKIAGGGSHSMAISREVS